MGAAPILQPSGGAAGVPSYARPSVRVPGPQWRRQLILGPGQEAHPLPAPGQGGRRGS